MWLRETLKERNSVPPVWACLCGRAFVGVPLWACLCGRAFVGVPLWGCLCGRKSIFLGLLTYAVEFSVTRFLSATRFRLFNDIVFGQFSRAKNHPMLSLPK
jgi:hypothetical protein